MLTNTNGDVVNLANLYRGQTAFLVCGGPSLLSHDLSLLQQRGILTFAVNNAATTVRPQLWTCTDEPGNFCDSIWRDPGILKFAPAENFDKPLYVRDSKDKLVLSSALVRHMPGMFAYERNEDFNAERFLTERTLNWGNHGDRVDAYGQKGSRSVMYVALKLLFHLGVRRVYLLGCDFRMEFGGQNYAFDQDRSKSSVNGNNRSYEILNVRLRHLLPHFQQAGFEVFNCTPNSGLTVFPHAPYEQAIARSLEYFPKRISTAGMYDRQKRERDAAKTAARQSATDNVASGAHDCTAASPRMSLEIVSHCWQYSHLLRYQLSSLILHPPAQVRTRMTVFATSEDTETVRTVEYFLAANTSSLLEIRLWLLPRRQLMRRAIGRNLAALASDADWVWFADCDYLFGPGCLDALPNALADVTKPLAFPREVLVGVDREHGHRLIDAAGGDFRVLPIDPAPFGTRRIRRAIGGIQIARGDVVRERGYLKDSRFQRRTGDTWRGTTEDVRFRKNLGTSGAPINLPNLFRIRHRIRDAQPSAHESILHPNNVAPLPDFTTVLAVDGGHVNELKTAWPTWRAFRPELLTRPMLVFCDDANLLEDWECKLAFLDHPNRRLIPWGMPGVSQREKMLSAFVLGVAREVATPWYLKLDTDAIAVEPGEWLQPAWFEPGEDGRTPVFIASPWGYTKPAEWLTRLQDWAATDPNLAALPTLVIQGKPRRRNGFRHGRMISWCFFGETAWTRSVAAYCPERLPIPSQDTFTWYCAARRGDFYRLIQMKQFGWRHVRKRHLRRLALPAPDSPLVSTSHSPLPTPTLTHPDTPKCQHSSTGVVYLLTGPSHAARLVVSINSLRRFYVGPITLYTTQAASHEIGARMEHDERLDITHRRYAAVQYRKNSSYLTKVALANDGPYDVNLFLDADTLVVGNIDELLNVSPVDEFHATHFAGWISTGRKMRQRIGRWRTIPHSEHEPSWWTKLVNDALQPHPAINLGVFAFRRNASILQPWRDLAWIGRDSFICDEVSLQLLLHRYPHRVFPSRFNYSAKYQRGDPDVRIWHFHGGKHLAAPAARALWLPEYNACLSANIGGLADWTPASDKRLDRYLRGILAIDH